MRNKILLSMLIFLCLNSLTGCGYLTGRTTEMISDYNTRLEETLVNFEILKQYAEENKGELIDFVTNTTNNCNGFTAIEDLNKVDITSTSHILTKDLYFTALDSIALREVLIFTGKQMVYVEVIWGADGVISITRRVV